MAACRFYTKILDQLRRCTSVAFGEVARKGSRGHPDHFREAIDTKICIKVVYDPCRKLREPGIRRYSTQARLCGERAAELRLSAGPAQEYHQIFFCHGQAEAPAVIILDKG